MERADGGGARMHLCKWGCVNGICVSVLASQRNVGSHKKEEEKTGPGMLGPEATT